MRYELVLLFNLIKISKFSRMFTNGLFCLSPKVTFWRNSTKQYNEQEAYLDDGN